MFQDLILNLHEKSLSNKTIKDIIMVIKSSLRKVFEENKIKSFSLKLVYPKEKNIKTIMIGKTVTYNPEIINEIKTKI